MLHQSCQRDDADDALAKWLDWRGNLVAGGAPRDSTDAALVVRYLPDANVKSKWK